MTLSMYQASVPALLRGLSNLSAILDKAARHADQRKIEPSVLLNTRLFPDMYPLVQQVQIAADVAKAAGARLAAIEPPKFPDNETSFDELKARIVKTIDFLKTLKPAQIDGSEARDITILIRGESHTFKGQPYLIHFILPNLYFHITTAYAILRHCGVEIGKRDFLGPQSQN